ncbi:MAG: hypothetical protein WA125_07915 [Desulfosporosinus sp.]
MIVLLLQGIPEQIAVATLAFVMAKVPVQWNQVISIGIILAICAYVVRLLPIPFGIHTILLIVLLFIALVWLGKGDFSLSLLASLLSFLALVIFEFVFMSLLMPVFGLTPEILATDSVKRIMIAEPQVILLFSAAFLLNRFYNKEVE